MHLIRLGLLTLCAALAAQAYGGTAFTADDLVRLQRIADPQASADGRYVVFVLRATDMAANRGHNHLWLIDRTEANPPARVLALNAANDSSPRWAPDSRAIYFLSTRSGSSQVWRLALGDKEPVQVTDYPLDVDSLKLSPSGDRIAVSMDVLPQCADLKCTKDTLEAERQGGAASGRPAGASVRSYSKLFVRHWDAWSDGTRSHLFVARLQADGRAALPVDVSKTLDADVPSKPLAPMRSSPSVATARASSLRRASPGSPSRGRQTLISLRPRWMAQPPLSTLRRRTRPQTRPRCS